MGLIQERGVQVKRVQYRCTRGHVFEDWDIRSAKPFDNIAYVEGPDSVKGLYCGMCLQEFLAKNIGQVSALPTPTPPQ